MIKVTKKCKISKKELRLGTPVEMEHTTSRAKARHIAMQHLCEFPNYYSVGLIPMERRLKQLNKRKAK
jgi:hypothetical protein